MHREDVEKSKRLHRSLLVSLALMAMVVGLSAQAGAAVSYDNDPPMFWKEITDPPS